MTITTINFEQVNTGSVANDGTGDSLREAFIKVNDNFKWMSNTGFNAGNIKATSAEFSSNVILAGAYKPTSNSSLGTAGQISWDSGNVYICVAANTWVRASLTSSF